MVLAAPPSAPIPGGVVSIPLKTPAKAIYFLGHRGIVVEERADLYAMLPIPLGTPAGRYGVKIEGRNGTVALRSVDVHPHDYPLQRIRLPSDRYVTPDAETLSRIRKEAIRKHKDKTFRSDHAPDWHLAWPVQGIVTSPFGLRRSFNGRPRSPHRGIDIAAHEGTPVYAASDGRVVDAGNFFFSGNLVFVEHGSGMITLYAHLQDIVVPVGTKIRKGELIGHVGHTGRATASHLHFGVSIDNVYVNPTLFLPKRTVDRSR